MAREIEHNLVVDGLTDEEQAALAEGAADDAAEAGTTDKAGDTEAAAAETGKTDGDAETGKAGEAEGDKGGETDHAAAAAAADTGTEKVADVADKPEPAQPALRQAVPQWEAPEDAAAKLKDIADKRDAFAEQFDAGEITAKQLLAEVGALDRDQREIERAVERAHFTAEMTTAAWLQQTVPAFLGANEHYEKNEALRGLLHLEVQRLQVEAQEAGKDQYAPSILATADANIKATLAGLGVKPGAGDTGKTETGKEKTPLVDKPEIMPTLSSVPAADISSTESRYAALDRLATADAEAYEDTLGKMSDADRDAYLARG